MVGINRVLLAGNLARDPQIKETGNGNRVATFSVAVNKRWRNSAGELKTDTTFFRIVVWNNTADICNRYLKKGRPVLVEGRLETRSYQNSEGKTQYMTQVVGDQVTFLGKPAGDEDHAQDEPSII
ncbi:MAG TPA: single-stranded DNA-binding protein [Candidatus Rifleibacterium sp.]|nr:single-stranded DNA-binding protein [Candidatus Rifleibacterium sp.]HPT47132.1 single-stranded DNA-binding protein [Candidatus Rifleibacterium sp.]